MLVKAAMVVWLESHLHSCIAFILLIFCFYCQLAGAKVAKIIQITKLFYEIL